MKDTRDTFIPYLTKIINDPFQTGNFPNELRLAEVALEMEIGKMLEKWKLVLDKGCNIGVIIMDLSKAFVTLNHELLLAKLNAYAFSENAVAYIKSYLLF